MSPRLSAAAIVAAIAALGGPSPAGAHDHWIARERLHDPVTGAWCCNEIDCAPVKDGGVREVAGGFAIVDTGEVFPRARVIWRSPDGNWWRCRNIADNSTRCLIGPPFGY
jgi:hypothetical protein